MPGGGGMSQARVWSDFALGASWLVFLWQRSRRAQGQRASGNCNYCRHEWRSRRWLGGEMGEFITWLEGEATP
jgi:hypothetical protein